MINLGISCFFLFIEKWLPADRPYNILTTVQFLARFLNVSN